MRQFSNFLKENRKQAKPVLVPSFHLLSLIMNLSADPDNIYLLEQLAEQSENAFLLYEVSKQRFRYISPAFETIWERNRSGLESDLNAAFNLIYPPDRQFVLRNWTWYRRPQRSNSRAFEFRLHFPDGRIKWLFAELFLVRDDHNNLVISGWVKDISARKNYLEVLKKYAARKNSVLEILTHDLNGFLGLIRNLCLGLSGNLQTADLAQIAGQLGLIEQISQRGSELITDLVNHEFIESSAVKLNRQRIDLVMKIEDILVTYRAAQKGMEKQFFFEATSPVIYACLDEVKFMQVINNLISNAIKFTPAGGKIRVWLEERVESVLIQISDTGIGIPEELQPKLFDRYTEAGRPGLRGEPSVGLGLHIIRNIVAIHKGGIWFNSRENEGTTFFIELPKN